MAQSATVNTRVSAGDGWTKVATDPIACTIHSNSGAGWQLAITTADSAPTVVGEKHKGKLSWQSGELTGYIWVRVTGGSVDFAVTVLT